MPRPRTPLIDRRDELALGSTLLVQDQVPLVTLTGPGGVGKTRLALQIAAEAAPAFADGVCFVDLSSVRDHNLVLSAIARAFDVADSGGQPLMASLVASLGPRHLLLVLDNLEQVIEAGPLIAELLERCPRLAMLATSRVVLRLSAEQSILVEPLAESDAAELFAARARAANPRFVQTSGKLSTVLEICRRLDGLPLAIELAAARVAVLPLPALLARLERTLALLTDGHRDRPDRLRTMRGAIAWSYALLPPKEQAFFRRLAVFAGGFAIDAAEAVAAGEDSPEGGAFGAILALIDHSLVRRAETEHEDEPRYRMLETIREFGLELLDAAGETEAVWRRHAEWALALAEEAGQGLEGSDQQAWLDRLETEFANLWAALDWTIANDPEKALRLGGALSIFWLVRGHHGVAHDVLTRALAAAQGSDRSRARAMTALAWLSSTRGDLAAAVALAEEARHLSRAAGDRRVEVEALQVIGLTEKGWSGTLDPAAPEHARRAEVALRQGLELAQEAGIPLYVAAAQHGLGQLAANRGDLTAAAEWLGSALAGFDALSAHRESAWARVEYGKVAMLAGNDAEAARLIAEALTTFRSLRDHWSAAQVFGVVAALAARCGWTVEAARLLGASDGVGERSGGAIDPAQMGQRDRTLAAVATLGDGPASAELAAGARLGLDDGVAEALDVLGRVALPGSAGSASGPFASFGLTAREVEILRLIAQGMTNREIAATVFLSVRTVERHIANAYAKIGVHGRAAATAFVLRVLT